MMSNSLVTRLLGSEPIELLDESIIRMLTDWMDSKQGRREQANNHQIDLDNSRTLTSFPSWDDSGNKREQCIIYRKIL